MPNKMISTEEVARGTSAPHSKRSWHGSAFIVESLVLLVFLMICLAVVIRLLGISYESTQTADRLTSAMSMVQENTEEFFANPDNVTYSLYYVGSGTNLKLAGDSRELTPSQTQLLDSKVASGSLFKLTRYVFTSPRPSGEYYTVDVSVIIGMEKIYSIETGYYMSEEEKQSRALAEYAQSEGDYDEGYLEDGEVLDD